MAARRSHESNVRHGHTRGGRLSPTYQAWNNMRRRCGDPQNHKFPIYGGRGISVCVRWTRFDEFLADMGEKPAGMTLDRVDVDGNYSPDNCRWASHKEQANNKTSNVRIAWGGQTKTCSEWADELAIPFVTLRMRLHRGWSTDRAFTAPLRKWP